MLAMTPTTPAQVRTLQATTLPGGRLPGLQVGIGFGILLLGQIVGALLAVFTVVLSGLYPADQIMADPVAFSLYVSTAPIPVILITFTTAIVGTAGFVLITRWLAPRTFTWTFRTPGIWRELGIGAAIGAALICLGVLVLVVSHAYRVVDVGPSLGILSGIGIGLGAALSEEAFFRGILFRVLNERWGSLTALLVVSLIFGFIHLTNEGATLWGAVAIILSAGLLLNAAYLLTNRWWMSVGLHFAWNATMAAVFGIDVSGTGSGRGLIESAVEGPVWLTGGSMGIEGSVPLVVIASLVGAGLLVLAIRRGQWRTLRKARTETAEAKAATV